LSDTKQKAIVNRITVDEKLSEGLFRFLVCRLKEGRITFKDRFGEWTEEKEKLVNPQNYYRTLKTKKSQAPPWENLDEGQVYLSGQFKEVGDVKKTNQFIIDPEKQNFMRIDNIPTIREGIKTLYSDILRGV
jgi:hypothetical protein